jgi:cob(I)alamin adenosyltransferase
MKKKTAKIEGLTVCLTGNGKGKTSAALGMIMRALAHKKKVLLVQFIKNSRSGEIDFLKGFSRNVTIRQCGAGFCNIVGDTRNIADHKRCAEEGLSFVREVFNRPKKEYDLIVLDEMNLTFKLCLLKVNAVLELLDQRPRDVHVVLTGRYAPKKIQEQCDLVSEIKEVKHPLKRGMRAQAIIEF